MRLLGTNNFLNVTASIESCYFSLDSTSDNMNTKIIDGQIIVKNKSKHMNVHSEGKCEAIAAGYLKSCISACIQSGILWRSDV